MKQQELQEEKPNLKPISILSQEMNLGGLNTIGFGIRSLIEDGKRKLFVVVRAWKCCLMNVKYC